MNDVLDDVKTVQETEIKITKYSPKQFKVVMLNDDGTPFEFVIQILIELFNKSMVEAVSLSMKIHSEGKGIAGVYTMEVAEMKSAETVRVARTCGYPLQTVVEEV